MSYHILLTIDVEDWFQVENFKQCIPFSSWSSYELRVEKNTHNILDLLDSANFRQNSSPKAKRSSSLAVLQPQTKVRATFFILGWIAERHPNLVREIHNRGHEIASHGYNHKLCTECSTEELKTDLIGSKKLLEDIIGAKVYGYRSPSFSINKEVLRLIEDSGYLYDSSYNSFGLHGRYGKISLNEQKRIGIAYKISSDFYEFPISNLKSKIQNLVLPWGGGGYFRLIPFAFFKRGIRSILEKEKAYLFYMHPWEIDPEQPKVKKAPFFFRLRHYVNLDRSISKLNALVESFKSASFVSCREYLASIGNE